MRPVLVCVLALVIGACFGGFDGPRPEAGTARGKARGSGANAGSAKGDDGKKKPAQSYKQAWTLICEAEKRSGASGDDRSARGADVASWIVRNLTNKQARYWFIAFGRAKQEHREALFVSEAKRAGIQDCALRQLLFGAQAKQPASAPASAPATTKDKK